MFQKYSLSVLWVAPMDSPKGQGRFGSSKVDKSNKKTTRTRRFSFELLKLELLELELLGLQLRESGSRGPGVLGPRAPRVLGSWGPGALGPWCPGVLDPPYIWRIRHPPTGQLGNQMFKKIDIAHNI